MKQTKVRCKPLEFSERECERRIALRDFAQPDGSWVEERRKGEKGKGPDIKVRPSRQSED
jgi:hypothetical protein